MLALQFFSSLALFVAMKAEGLSLLSYFLRPDRPIFFNTWEPGCTIHCQILVFYEELNCDFDTDLI